MADPKPIHIEPTSDTARLLEQADEIPLTVESRGRIYRIERQERTTLENYDPAKALAGLRSGIGLYDGIDVKTAMREIREQRDQADRGWDTE